jgi:CorA-like Mg2+ transporter protein
LQGSVTNILNIKQNQIVKIFTIITAVFLPPTLVATFYGMNFAIMPELSSRHGFIYSVILILVGALLPLVYIKWKGWLTKACQVITCPRRADENAGLSCQNVSPPVQHSTYTAHRPLSGDDRG